MSELDPKEPCNLVGRIFSDFKISFPNAQGDYGLQRHYFMLASENYTTEGIIDVPLSLQIVNEKILKLSVPKQHVVFTRDKQGRNMIITPNVARDEFQDRWNEFTYALQLLHAKTPPLSIPDGMEPVFRIFLDDRPLFLRNMTEKMLMRDIKFISTGRPDGGHKSFFRNHGLLSTPTGSQVIDHAYQNAASVVKPLLSTDGSEITPELQTIYSLAKQLQIGWEIFNPGESFVSEK